MNRVHARFLALTIVPFLLSLPVQGQESKDVKPDQSEKANGCQASGANGAGSGSSGAGDYNNAVGKVESNNTTNITNKDSGAAGQFQFTKPAFIEVGIMNRDGSFNPNNKYGVTSISDFKTNATAQLNAQNDFTRNQLGYMRNLGITNYVGKPVGGNTYDLQTLQAGAHQVGPGGLQSFLASNGDCNAPGARDNKGKGLCVKDYMNRFQNARGGGSGNNSSSSACQENQNLDKTSKTCTPTIPMLQAIPCEKYPSALQGFCYKYKPLQMNMQECQAAEKYAQGASKGNRQGECENQTFGKGTSAWSFVLACSFAKTDQGQLGDATQAKQQTGSTTGNSGSGGGQTTGTEADPQCVNKLRAKIPDIKVLGQYSFGGGCTVASAVRFRGKAVDFGSELTMDCSLAEKMEEFGEALKGMGVTRLTNYGTLACRNIRNASGTSNTKSSHGYGMAVDIASFRTGSGEMSVTKYFSDQATRNFLENQILPLACKTFKGVLGPRFYKGKYLHYHFETKARTRCDGSG